MKHVFTMLVLLFITATSFSQTFTVDGLNYTVISTSTNEVQITEGTLTATDLVIPETVTFGGSTFTVTRVGTAAFRFATIENLTLPASVNNIGSVAFNANGSMRTVLVLNPNLPFLQISGFNNRRNINLTVPDAALDSYLNNNQWNSSTNDDNPQSSEDARRFYSINGVYTSTIGRGYIRDNLVYESINRNEAVAKVLLKRKNTGSLPSNFVIPNGFSFRGTNFTVTAIDANAFDNEGLVSVVFPESLEVIGQNALRFNELTSVVIPNSVTVIEDGVFAANRLTSILIPDSVTSIGGEAFRDNQLTSVTIPNSVTTIGDSAFRHNNLENVSLPNSLTSIGFRVFLQNDLTSVTIPNSVTSIGGGAFTGNQLTSVTIPESVTVIEDGVFAANRLTSILIPNSVTSIGNLAFSDNQLTSVLIPNSVISIGIFAFLNNQLTSVTIPNSVTTIGGSAFTNNQLAEVISEGTLPASITTGFPDSFGVRSEIDLIVPEGTTQTYLEAEWTGFRTITEIDSGNRSNEASLTVETPLATTLDPDKVSLFITNEGVLHIDAGEANVKGYTVYNMFGFQVYQGRENTVSLAHLSRGIYIVHIDFEAATTVVKKVMK